MLVGMSANNIQPTEKICWIFDLPDIICALYALFAITRGQGLSCLHSVVRISTLKPNLSSFVKNPTQFRNDCSQNDLNCDRSSQLEGLTGLGRTNGH